MTGRVLATILPAALLEPGLDDGAVRLAIVLLVLGSDEPAGVNVPQRLLASRIGCTPREVRRRLRTLRDAELVTSEQRRALNRYTPAQSPPRARPPLARVKRDYTRGAITAEDWGELRRDLESEHSAALAERDRLAGNVEAVRQPR